MSEIVAGIIWFAFAGYAFWYVFKAREYQPLTLALNPECEIRNCCMERKLDLCFECSQFPCDKVKGNERMVKTASEYKKLGREKWLCLQIKKVQNGYELHTRKYYPHTLAKPE